MAKKGAIARQKHRQKLVDHHFSQRRKLKTIISHPDSSPEERGQAVRKLNRLPRNSSPARLRNRDVIDGRPRAYYRAFGLSRLRLRELALRGELPGVRKASR